MEQGLTTQRVTAKDIAGGRIRIPIGEAKSAFPETRQRVQIDLRGELVNSVWDPKFGSDRERSGVLSVPRAVLKELVQEDSGCRFSASPMSSASPELDRNF